MFWEPCSESQLLKLYEDYNITEKSLKNDVEYLLEWMKQEPHLPDAEGQWYIENSSPKWDPAFARRASVQKPSKYSKELEWALVRRMRSNHRKT